MKEFLEDIIEEMKVIQKEGQQLEFDYKGSHQFTSDKRMLKNIVINLVSNALKFSPERSTIWISVKNESSRLELVVKDEGVGIPEEDQQHLFDTFFRAKNVINIQGTGLGLTIVKRYLDLLKGNIELISSYGKGTTVKVFLPELKPAEF